MPTRGQFSRAVDTFQLISELEASRVLTRTIGTQRTLRVADAAGDDLGYFGTTLKAVYDAGERWSDRYLFVFSDGEGLIVRSDARSSTWLDHYELARAGQRVALRALPSCVLDEARARCAELDAVLRDSA